MSEHRRVATCSCGQLRAETDAEPKRVSVCHCWACQKRTGSAFGAQVRFPREEVTITGESRVWERRGDEGALATFHFCGTCGATVYYLLDVMPDDVAIPLGAFASHDLPTPVFSVYEARRHPWVTLTGEGIERWD